MAIDAVSRFLDGVGARRLAEGEWGLTIPDQHPLDIGIRVVDGLVRVQAFAVPAADAPADADVLHWNRASRLIRFGRTRSGDVWVQADLLLEGLSEAAIDQVLGLVVEAARAARATAYAPAAGIGDANPWLPGPQRALAIANRRCQGRRLKTDEAREAHEDGGRRRPPDRA